MKTILYCLSFLSLVPSNLFAQWEKLPMPVGGDIQNLQTAHDRVWSLCSYKNYYSDDQGASWHHWRIQDTLEAKTLYLSDSVAVAMVSSTRDVSNPNRNVYESDDNGNSWHPVFIDSLHQFIIINAFAAGGYLYFLHDGIWGNYLSRSADHGATWQNIDVAGNGIGDRKLGNITVSGNKLLAFMIRDDGIGSPVSYLVVSYDYGNTWSTPTLPFSINNGLLTIQDNCWIHKYHSIDPTMQVSFDGGDHFTEIAADHCKYNYLYVPPATIYGYNFDCIEKYVPLTNSWMPINLSPTAIRLLVQTAQGTLVAGYNKGIWRSPNATSNWLAGDVGLENSVASRLVEYQNRIILLSETGLHSSADQCQTWNNLNFNEDSYELVKWGDTLVTYNTTSVQMSADGGSGWKNLLHTSISPFFVMENFKVYGDSLFILNQQSFIKTLLFTPDRGAGWDTIFPPPTVGGAEVTDYFMYGGKIWIVIGGYDAKVYYSENGGHNWSLVSLPDGPNVYHYNFFTENQHFFLDGNSQWYSPDAGATWTTATGLPAGKKIIDIASGGNGKWYAAVDHAGVFVSEDFGATWSFFNDPGFLQVIRLFPVAQDLYAYRVEDGLWRWSSLLSATTTPGGESMPGFQLTPNPAHDMVTLHLTAQSRSELPVRIFDVLGNIQWQSALGNGDTPLHIEDWKAGVYFVQAGDQVERLVKY